MCRRLLKIILPCTGQCAFDHCVSACNVKDVKEERGNQGPKGEVFSRVRKEGGDHTEGDKEGVGSFYKRRVGLIW